MFWSNKIIIVLALTVFTLSACVVVPVGKDIDTDGPLDLTEGIVFGFLQTVVLDRHGEKFNTEQEPRLYFTYKLEYSSSDSIDLKRSFPGLYTRGFFAEGISAIPNVFFAKRLPVGEYSIHSVNMDNQFFIPDIRFRVAPNQVTYIGSIQFEYQAERKKRGVPLLDRKVVPLLSQKVKYRVVNNYPEATAQLAKKYPNFSKNSPAIDLARVQQ